MFRYYRVILRESVINTLPSYTSISNVAVGKTVYSNAKSCIWNTCANWQAIDYKLPQDDTMQLKHVVVW